MWRICGPKAGSIFLFLPSFTNANYSILLQQNAKSSSWVCVQSKVHFIWSEQFFHLTHHLAVLSDVSVCECWILCTCLSSLWRCFGTLSINGLHTHSSKPWDGPQQHWRRAILYHVACSVIEYWLYAMIVGDNVSSRIPDKARGLRLFTDFSPLLSFVNDAHNRRCCTGIGFNASPLKQMRNLQLKICKYRAENLD